jgi:hypothetical protein
MNRFHVYFFVGALQQCRRLRHLARHDAHLVANAVRRVV